MQNVYYINDVGYIGGLALYMGKKIINPNDDPIMVKMKNMFLVALQQNAYIFGHETAIPTCDNEDGYGFSSEHMTVLYSEKNQTFFVKIKDNHTTWSTTISLATFEPENVWTEFMAVIEKVKPNIDAFRKGFGYDYDVEFDVSDFEKVVVKISDNMWFLESDYERPAMTLTYPLDLIGHVNGEKAYAKFHNQ